LQPEKFVILALAAERFKTFFSQEPLRSIDTLDDIHDLRHCPASKIGVAIQRLSGISKTLLFLA
jgi:hypothetical protein